MNNNQGNSNNLRYQYNVTTNEVVTPISIPSTNKIEHPTVRSSIKKVRFEPSLERAKKALKLVNPFRGV